MFCIKNKYIVPIGQLWSMSMKIVLESFMTNKAYISFKLNFNTNFTL